MCGIAGHITKTQQPTPYAGIERMTALVSHRGPDGVGTWAGNSVSLGHRRLSILDLSVRGAQPMVDSTTNRAITYNGEIYNYLELREVLSGEGYRFFSDTDTEVILHAYDHWGPACVERFNGMWAFAICDEAAMRVFCSRDRFGIKPFYFANTDDSFAFGSEIRQLLPERSERTANADVLRDFIVSRVAEPIDSTFFSGINKLPGGHNLSYDLRSHQFSIERYYELRQRPEIAELSAEQTTEQFAEILTSAITLRLRSDVRVGTCLSGGLDSSSIASIASGAYANQTNEPFSALTAVSEDPATDESAFAKTVAEHANLNWIQLRPSYQDFKQCIDTVAIAQEEPFASASIVMQHAVMKAARDASIPVLLDGQGGDEILLGYERYFANQIAGQVQRADIAGAVSTYRGLLKNGRPGSTKSLLTNLGYYHAQSLRNIRQRKTYRFLKPEFLTGGRAESQDIVSTDMFANQRQEIVSTSLPAMLRYEDKNSMWHSIETRLPFLDYRLAEFSVSAPLSHKLQNGWTKLLLRRAVETKLPREIVWRKNKFGFEAPESQWLRQHAALVRDEIQSSPLLTQLCNGAFLEKAEFDALNQGLRWRLYSVALWARHFNVTSVH